MRPLASLLLLAVSAPPALAPAARADEAPRAAPSPERGYRHLTETPYHPPAFDQATFDALWTTWPEPLRSRAREADAAERRRLAYARYGLTPRPGDPLGRPLQYVVDAQGRWSMNCFACHGGQVAGTVVPGLPNADFAMATLFEDVLAARGGPARATTLLDLLWNSIPLGENHGTTNAVTFSVALLAFRNADLEVVLPRSPPRFVHHDLDAPPWWNLRKRSHLYVDGFAPKGHRALMQFLLVPTNGRDRLVGWEADFRDVLAYVESLAPPRWPWGLDPALAARGRVAFETHCASCHGTYGAEPTYPERAVPMDVVGTDPVRHEAIAAKDRAAYAKSWFTAYDPRGVVVEPVGYVAPPLDGVWASAPYFHNGSVPTLWHVLHPEDRPDRWRRRGYGAYDRDRVGLDVEAGRAGDAVGPVTDPWERRAWFDTRRPGKSAAGHRFPDALTEEEKRAVLEYLKSL